VDFLPGAEELTSPGIEREFSEAGSQGVCNRSYEIFRNSLDRRRPHCAIVRCEHARTGDRKDVVWRQHRSRLPPLNGAGLRAT
jgi:hypothetical protein